MKTKSDNVSTSMCAFAQVTFHDKTGFELLETLNSILVYLDEKQHDVDLRSEGADLTGTRIAQFLSMMRYDPIRRGNP